MRKHRRGWLILLAVLVCAGVCAGVYQGMRRSSSSVYSSVGNEKRYEVSFDMLNTQLEHTYELAAGDSVQVDIDRRGGHLDVRIGMAEHPPVYRGDGADSGRFTVTVDEAGTYVLSVQGKAAEGSVAFSILRANDGTEV